MPPAEPRRGQGGFTLLEVIIVIAILGLVGGLVLTRAPRRGGAFDMREASALVVGAFRGARGRAIATNRVVPVQLDPAGPSVQLGAEAAKRLPPGIAFAGGPRLMLFRPDGGSTGGDVILQGGARRTRVEVNWLTGRVSVDALPP